MSGVPMQRIKKLWPQKRWKKILLTTFLALLIIAVSLLAYASVAMNNDVITELKIENSQGTKTALILYHPGLTSFSHDIAYAYADGLVSNNWRVEITTSSIQAPTDLSNYDLLVVLSNTYAFTPDKPTMRQLDRMGNLDGIQTVLITLGAGSAQESKTSLESTVSASNGDIVQSLLLYSMAANEGEKAATEIAIQAAQQIT
jgi:hypothetical protein